MRPSGIGRGTSSTTWRSSWATTMSSGRRERKTRRSRSACRSEAVSAGMDRRSPGRRLPPGLIGRAARRVPSAEPQCVRAVHVPAGSLRDAHARPERDTHPRLPRRPRAPGGNARHSDARRRAACALETVELVVATNVDRYGAPTTGLPKGDGVSIRFVQFEIGPEGELAGSIVEALGSVDVGIVPNALPISHREQALGLTAWDEPWLSYEPFDFLVRFKASSNPGRLYPFARCSAFRSSPTSRPLSRSSSRTG